VEKFLLVYYGGKMAATEEEAKKSMDAWMKWFQDMGKAVVDAGAPSMPGKIVGKGSPKEGFIGDQPVSGYSILQADNIDKAVNLAKSSPVIADGGQIAVYSLMAMKM
jgi:hypothetical protein